MIFKNISKRYRSEDGNTVEALKDINLAFDSGLIMLLGVSGTGKSTMLNIISGLDSVTEGELIIDDINYTNLSQTDWDGYRLKNVGVVFQESNLIHDMDVYDNLALPLKLIGINQKEINNRIMSMLDKVGVKDLIHRKVWQLSAGQRQRIAIARGLIKEPKVLVLDEPTGNLDVKNSENIFELLYQLKSECLVIVATHDELNANKYADRVITLSNGIVIDDKTNKIDGNKVIEKVNIQRVNDDSNVSVINGFNNESIINFVKRAIMENSCDREINPIDIDLKLQVYLREEINKTNSKEMKQENELDVTSKKNGLPFKDIVKFAINNLKIRKIRLTITILLFMLSISLIMLFANLTQYEYKDVMIDYMKQNDIDYVPVHRNVSYRDIFNNELNQDISSGKNLINDMYNQFDSKNIIKVYYLDGLFCNHDEKQLFGVPILIGDNNNYEFNIIGSNLANDNDIMISALLCEQLFPDKAPETILNTKLYWDKIELNISGIICKNEISGDKYKKYGYMIGSNNFMHLVEKNMNYIKLESADISESSALYPYVSSHMKYGSQDLADKNDLIWGRMPENENEVLIQRNLAEQMGYDFNEKDSLKEKKIEFINIEDKKYNGAFDCINMYSYFKNGITIVGIYNSSSDNKIIDAQVLIQDEIYQTIKELYYNYYIYDELITHIDNYRYFVSKCEKENIIIDEIGCDYIYKFRNIIFSVKKILTIFVVISFSLALFLLITFISYSIKDQAKKIGILRTLGVSLRNTVSIFLVEASVITSISLVLGFIVFEYILYQINIIYNRHMAYISFDIIEAKPFVCLIIVVIIYLMSFTAMYLPLHNMSKKKPIDLLNKN